MKKTLIVFSVLLLASTVYGQVKKGAWFIGGDMGFSSNESNSSSGLGSKNSGFRFVPVVGHAVKENLIAGFFLLFSASKTNSDIPENDTKQNVKGGGLFLRKYKRLGKSDFSIFGQVTGGFEIGSNIRGETTTQKQEQDVFSTRISIYPGVSYKLSKRLQMEAGFSSLLSVVYSQTKFYLGSVNPIRSETEGLSVNVYAENIAPFHVGFRLLLNN